MTGRGRPLLAAAALVVAMAGLAAAEPPAASAPSVESAPRADSAPPGSAAADHALVERILRESGVVSTSPRPSVRGYLADVLWRFFGWLLRYMRAAQAWVVTGTIAVYIALGILASAVLASLTWLLARLVRGSPRGPAAGPRVSLETQKRPEAPPDRGAWALELERCLAGQDVAGAREALWWWFARSVYAGAVEAAWTSREVLARASRLDLAPLVGDLDVMIYGKHFPSPSEVRGLFTRMQEALP